VARGGGRSVTGLCGVLVPGVCAAVYTHTHWPRCAHHTPRAHTLPQHAHTHSHTTCAHTLTARTHTLSRTTCAHTLTTSTRVHTHTMYTRAHTHTQVAVSCPRCRLRSTRKLPPTCSASRQQWASSAHGVCVCLCCVVVVCVRPCVCLCPLCLPPAAGTTRHAHHTHITHTHTTAGTRARRQPLAAAAPPAAPLT
jgi:hypothetical protein